MKKKRSLRLIITAMITGMLVLGAVLILHFQDTSAADSEGVKFSFPGLDGKAINLEDYRGKVVLVDVWATWCPPCRMEIPGFIKLYDEYKDKGLVIIGISIDEDGIKAVKPFAEEFKINYPIALADGSDVTKVFGPIRGIPTKFLIDKDGKIVQKMVGYRDEDALKKVFMPLLDNVSI